MYPSMEVPASPHADRFHWTLLKRLVTVTFAEFAALLIVVLVHGFVGGQSLVFPAEVLTWALAALAAASIIEGVVWGWVAYPQHRRAVAFVAAVTLITLLAHAYIIDTPAASTSGSASGQGGTTFSSDQAVADTSVTNGTLKVTLTANGNAIAQASVSANGAPLSGGWDGSPPSFVSPLQPGTSITGTWNFVPTGPSERVTVSYQYLTCYDTKTRSYGCIMDEIFYVPEGMGMLAGQHCSTGPGAPSNCHLEHPPLVTALIASGMAMFGTYSAVGWRVMPALLGAFSIPLLFGIVWKVSESKKAAYLSATLLALDVMFFSQSSAAVLDVPEVFFGLAAFFVYFAGLRVWKFDRTVLAGVFLGVAALAKETALFIALAFVTYVLFFGEGRRWTRVYSVFKVALVVALVFAAGLQVYDSALATPQYPTFVGHVGYILSYGSSLIADKLACQPTTGYWCKFPGDAGGAPILPTDWLTYYSPVEYLGICATINGVCQSGYLAVAYYGVTNLLETWTVYVWVPLVAFGLYTFRKGSKAPSGGESAGEEPAGGGPEVTVEPPPPSRTLTGDVKFAGLALILFLWSYVPYLFLFLAGRVTYPFYIIPGIPAMAMGTAFWLSRDWFPRWLLYLYMVMVFVFFLVYFPDKAFLPVWLRILIGH